MQILIVQEDPKVRSFLSRGLSEAGMSCEAAPDAATALEMLAAQHFDLVLLDVMLSGEQGLAVLEALRQGGTAVPMLWVSATESTGTAAGKGAEGGPKGADEADRPFAFNELLARIRAVLTRHQPGAAASVGDVEIDYVKGTVVRAGIPVDLTRTELALLRHLVERRGRPVSRTELLQAVWGIGFDTGTNIVDVHIRRLRKKIDEPFDSALIHTVRGSGYAIDVQEPEEREAEADTGGAD